MVCTVHKDAVTSYAHEDLEGPSQRGKMHHVTKLLTKFIQVSAEYSALEDNEFPISPH